MACSCDKHWSRTIVSCTRVDVLNRKPLKALDNARTKAKVRDLDQAKHFIELKKAIPRFQRLPSVVDLYITGATLDGYRVGCPSAASDVFAFNSSAARSIVSRVMRSFSKCVLPYAKLRRCSSCSAGV